MHPLEQMQMANQSLQHEVMRFLHGLNSEQLDGLQILLRACTGEGGETVAALHSGMIDQIQHFKFKRCACGGKCEQAEDLLGKVEPEPPARQVTEAEILNEAANMMGALSGRPVRTGAQLMKDYRLEIRPGDGALVCRDCGLWYQSLQDRMLKDPDDCHGCHLKSKTG